MSNADSNIGLHRGMIVRRAFSGRGEGLEVVKDQARRAFRYYAQACVRNGRTPMRSDEDARPAGRK